MAILRRKRLADGTFGEIENVFQRETDAEKMARLESENADLKASLSDTQLAIAELANIVLGGDATRRRQSG